MPEPETFPTRLRSNVPMSIAADVRYALRLLAKSPLFAGTAVLSLAAGVAGTASIFSLADAILLRPRTGIVEPATLVDIGRSVRGEGMDNFGYPLFEAMRDGTTTLAAVSAHQFSPQVMSLGDAKASERVFASLVSHNYFEIARRTRIRLSCSITSSGPGDSRRIARSSVRRSG